MSKRKKAKEEAEKLVRTQVLNIDELRKVVKYEKKISKKPALICAVLGTFMLAIGTTLQGVIVYNDKNETIQYSERKILDDEVITPTKTEVSTSLTCYLSSQGNANGTNYESHFTYNFVDDKLKGATKIFLLDKILENPLGEQSMTNLYVAYQGFEKNVIPGISIKTSPRGDYGFQVTTQIDLTKLNMSMVPENYQNNPQVRVDFMLDTDSKTVKTTAESSGYICTFNQN